MGGLGSLNICRSIGGPFRGFHRNYMELSVTAGGVLASLPGPVHHAFGCRPLPSPLKDSEGTRASLQAPPISFHVTWELYGYMRISTVPKPRRMVPTCGPIQAFPRGQQPKTECQAKCQGPRDLQDHWISMGKGASWGLIFNPSRLKPRTRLRS